MDVLVPCGGAGSTSGVHAGGHECGRRALANRRGGAVPGREPAEQPLDAGDDLRLCARVEGEQEGGAGDGELEGGAACRCGVVIRDKRDVEVAAGEEGEEAV
jgi:hypothetical protein